jgi:hypothetical protein
MLLASVNHGLMQAKSNHQQRALHKSRVPVADEV